MASPTMPPTIPAKASPNPTSTQSHAAEEPFNFSWAIPGLLAGSGFPRTLANLQYLVDGGVDVLVTLNAEKKPPVDDFNARATAFNATKTLEWVKVDIVDFATPTKEQIDLVMNTIEDASVTNKKVCIHCTMGQGRTGTMIACWLAKSRRLTGEEAINLTRQLRPHSIETVGQENVIKEYAGSLTTGS